MSLISTVVAIVPAAGTGQRMQSFCPKQYLRIGDKTVLEYTLGALLTSSYIKRIIVVLKENDPYYAQLTIANHPRITAVVGGKTRAESVLAGLRQLQGSEWALVHDAVRPCVTQEDINKLIEAVLPDRRGGILAVPLVDTIKQVAIDSPVRIEKTHDRRFLWLAMTPQCFLTKDLKIAIEKALAKQLNITDEASAIEYNGGQPLVVTGRRDNIKITCKEDLSLAQFYLRDRPFYNISYNRESQCE